MLENATRICEANFGSLSLNEGDANRVVAMHNAPPAYAELRQREPTWKPTGLMGRVNEQAIASKRAVQIADLAGGIYKDDPLCRIFTTTTQARSFVIVPLLKENESIGVMAIYRQEVRPFTDKQVDLLTNFAAQAVIAIENARLLNELRQRTDDLTESLEQQTATSEVLRVISSSPGELEPVFNAMLENATRICEAKFGNLLLFDGKDMRVVAMHNAPRAHEEARRQNPIVPLKYSILGPLVRTKKLSHVADIAAEEPYASSALAKAGGMRTALAIPMLKEGKLIGAIGIFRQEVRPFTDKQIALVTNFAAQAVIAIENTRLLNELRQRTDDLTESLQQQTATSEVLKVISSSPGELQPVFQAMLENATRICEAKFGTLFRFDGNRFCLEAQFGSPPALIEAQKRRGPFPPTPGTVLDRVVQTKQVSLSVDYAAEPVLGLLATLGGARSTVSVPMLKDDELIGAITIYRQEVRPFTDKQIALVQNFAAQAVIAIENTRLLNELRKSLEQQTATADVLKVISSSPGELEPVFQAMLENATRICEAKFGTLLLCEGDALRAVALHGGREDYADERRRNPVFRPAPNVPVMRAVRTKQVQHVADMRTERAYIDRDTAIVTMVETAGARTFLAVPMLKDDEAVGVIIIYRQEVRPFSDKQIALVQNFAAQAVIAIENTRLLNELRQRTDDLTEALEQQTATSEVLSVISSSPGELEPVFQAMLENATRICEAKFGTLFRFDGKVFHPAAQVGTPPKLFEFYRQRGPFLPEPDTQLDRVMRTKQVNHTADYAAETAPGTAARLGGARSTVAVPMLKDDELVGAIVIYRQEVRPFTDKQIALVQNFAAQAVIAIENTRLLNELRQRTDDLSKSLDDLRTAQDRLVQTQKLASLGQLTAGIAHEIKNPLNFVNNFSGVSVELIDELNEALARVTADDKTRAEIAELANTLRDNLDKIVQHGKRADAIVRNMLLHSRQGSGEHRPVEINTLVEESLNLAYHGARAEKQGFNITMERSFDPAAGEADLFPQEITRVLLNLIANGFYAATKRKADADGGNYEPTLAAATKSLGNSVEIRIRDNGAGIPAEVKEKMFNPFFTTKPAGEGTGLGLSISHDIIVKQHGGSIEVDTQPGEFTEFRIVLPRRGASLIKSG